MPEDGPTSRLLGGIYRIRLQNHLEMMLKEYKIRKDDHHKSGINVRRQIRIGRDRIYISEPIINLMIYSNCQIDTLVSPFNNFFEKTCIN